MRTISEIPKKTINYSKPTDIVVLLCIFLYLVEISIDNRVCQAGQYADEVTGAEPGSEHIIISLGFLGSPAVKILDFLKVQFNKVDLFLCL